jgi:hypothetical protein
MKKTGVKKSRWTVPLINTDNQTICFLYQFTRNPVPCGIFQVLSLLQTAVPSSLRLLGRPWGCLMDYWPRPTRSAPGERPPARPALQPRSEFLRRYDNFLVINFSWFPLMLTHLINVLDQIFLQLMFFFLRSRTCQIPVQNLWRYRYRFVGLVIFYHSSCCLVRLARETTEARPLCTVRLSR